MAREAKKKVVVKKVVKVREHKRSAPDSVKKTVYGHRKTKKDGTDYHGPKIEKK